MKKILVSTLAVVLSFVAAARAWAADAKPVVVVSLPSYDALVKDIAYVGKVVGIEGAERHVEGVLGMFGGLDGFDKAKPLGFALTTDGGGFTGLGFIPVTDAGKLLKSLEAVVASEDAGEGVKKLSRAGGGGQTIYMKTKGGWAYVAQDADALGDLPDDPLKILGGLEKDYDVAARIHLQNIPALFRDLVINGIEQGVKATLKRKGADESPEQFEARKKTVEAQVDQIVALINDLDQITIGWNIDATGKKMYLDLGSTVLADSKTAKKFAEQLKDLTTSFSGFYRDDAAFSLNAVSKMSAEDATTNAAAFGEIRKQILERIESSGDFEDDDQKAKFKALTNKMMDVFDGLIKGGKFDVGMAVLGEGPFTLAYGMYVPDAAAADKAVRDVVKLAEDEKVLAKVEYDAEKSEDLKFHRITPQLGDAAEHVKKILGDDPKIIVGIGKNSLYLAVGTDGIKTLQGLIATSKAGASKPALPVQMSIAASPILKFAAKQDPTNEIVAALSKAAEGGKDHLRITGRPIANGEIVRIEIEEGVVKMIAASVMTLQRAFGAGFAPAPAEKAFPPKSE